MYIILHWIQVTSENLGTEDKRGGNLNKWLGGNDLLDTTLKAQSVKGIID